MNMAIDALRTPEVPWWMIVSLRNYYRIMEDFVETGTCNGVTSETAATLFTKVQTIEIDPKMFAIAKARLGNNKRVKQHLGDSAVLLPEILKTLSDRAVFWLDGHWSGGNKIAKTECPLLDEIRAINTRGDCQDCVLIDNIGMMTKPPHAPHNPEDWPTISKVVSTAKENPKWSVQRIGDTLFLTPDPIFQVY